MLVKRNRESFRIRMLSYSVQRRRGHVAESNGVSTSLSRGAASTPAPVTAPSLLKDEV